MKYDKTKKEEIGGTMEEINKNKEKKLKLK